MEAIIEQLPPRLRKYPVATPDPALSQSAQLLIAYQGAVIHELVEFIGSH